MDRHGTGKQRPEKKLLDAVRIWAGGGDDNGESFRKSAAKLGADSPEKNEPEPFIVWPENWLVIQLLPLIQWQYIVGDKVLKNGVDQIAVWELIDRHPESPSDKQAAFLLFTDLVEAGNVVCEVWNK